VLRDRASSPRCPRIAVTPGEPAGIGPDICIALAQEDHDAQIVCVADPELLQERAGRLGWPLTVDPWTPEMPLAPSRAGRLWVAPLSLTEEARPGQLDPANAGYVLATLRHAVQGCLAGDFDALVTGPVHKGVINEAGMRFSGHTEFLAALTGGWPVMMLVCPGLRVALVTTHLPLAEVPAAITAERLEKVVGVLHRDLVTRFGIAQPRILVCGLNPHAGEDGYLGREEQDVIAPTLVMLQDRGIHALGPFPADTVFTPRHLEGADAVLAMYHDQGLPTLKHKGFGRAVNVTLGLPVIRTSVDHGTAAAIAGTGEADAGSLREAVKLAVALSARKTR
jgi:4-hydroxythreonine-4-phosphate dehydrogenase